MIRELFVVVSQFARRHGPVFRRCGVEMARLWDIKALVMRCPKSLHPFAMSRSQRAKPVLKTKSEREPTFSEALTNTGICSDITSTVHYVSGQWDMSTDRTLYCMVSMTFGLGFSPRNSAQAYVPTSRNLHDYVGDASDVTRLKIELHRSAVRIDQGVV